MSDAKSLPFRERALRAFDEEMGNLMRLVEEHRTQPLEEIDAYREPLSVEARKEVTVLLSWGGPSDGFKVYFDENGEAISGVYFLSDWSEYEELWLSQTELHRVLLIYF